MEVLDGPAVALDAVELELIVKGLGREGVMVAWEATEAAEATVMVDPRGELVAAGVAVPELRAELRLLSEGSERLEKMLDTIVVRPVASGG